MLTVPPTTGSVCVSTLAPVIPPPSACAAPATIAADVAPRNMAAASLRPLVDVEFCMDPHPFASFWPPVSILCGALERSYGTTSLDAQYGSGDRSEIGVCRRPRG